MKIKLTNPIKGFTLIELMVAIAIVAVLATIGYTILQTAQASGRDAKRRQDIDAASQSLETNWIPTSAQYPRLVGTMFTTGAIPADPLNSGTYVYSWNGINNAGGSTYIICALLEKGGGNSDSNNSMSAGATYYCKKNQQQ